MDKRLQQIIDNMPKITAESTTPVDVDEEALQGKYDLLVDLIHSRPLTEEELKFKAAVEHIWTCDDPEHMHGVIYTYWDNEG